MQFRELVLHNVGAYRGRQIIDLTVDDERPIILVGGLNGCGKTTFLDAIQLVLYGNRARCAGRETQAYEEYLRNSISWGASPEDGAAIRLTFDIDEDGQQRVYEVTRAWSATKSRVKEVVDVRIDGRRDPAASENWSDFVEELLPLDIAGLFFFDGEKIAALADPDTAGSVVRTAVHSLLGVSSLQQLRTDLLALQRRQVINGIDPRVEQKIADLTQEVARVQLELDVLAQRRAQVSGDRVKAEKELARAEADFHRQGGGLFERRVELEAELSGVKAQIHQRRVDARALAEGALPLALVQKRLEAIRDIDAQEVAGEQERKALAILHERDEWLLTMVDAPLKSELAKHLSDDLERRSAAANTPVTLALSGEGRGLLAGLGQTLAEQKQAAEDAISSLNLLLSQAELLERHLAAVPERDAIADLIAAVDALRTKVAELKGAEGALSDEYNRLVDLREQSEAALSKSHSERLHAALDEQDVQRIVDHAERVRETLERLEERLLRKHIGRVEVATLDSFRRLMRKEGLVRDIQIDPETFTLSLMGDDGLQIDSGRLSAGERQLLAIALLWGIARVAGGRIPTIVDTPLGRLDSHHRRFLVERYFPEVGNQVLLLSTDEEFDEGLAIRLAPSISRAYLLQHDDDQKTTTVKPGYWWPLEVTHVA